MSEFYVPLKRVMLLQSVLDNGGRTSCSMHRPETIVDAQIKVENDTHTHRLEIRFGPLTGSITLQRDDTSKYMALRDFLQDLANGRTESGRQSEQAIAMLEALERLNEVIGADQVAYITPTTDPIHPYGAVVTNELGEVCAAATGTCKDHLAEAVRTQLRPKQVGSGKRP